MSRDAGWAGRLVRLANGAVNAVTLVTLLFLFAMGCYALWDSQAIDSQAASAAWKPYKPVEPELLSFKELESINPDVRGWLTVYGTNIDYPVCQNKDINKYLTTDARGEYALSGAIFLEPQAAPDFSDFATFIYGHHMEHDVMFGQVSDFLEQGFFNEHRYGNLFDGEGDRGLEFVCCLSADAYDGSIYRTSFASAEEKEEYLDLLRSRATCARDVQVGADDRIVLLSTCASESTNGRTLLVGIVREQVFDDPFVTWPNLGTGVDGRQGFMGLPWYAWVLLAVMGTLAIAVGVSSWKDARAKRARG